MTQRQSIRTFKPTAPVIKQIRNNVIVIPIAIRSGGDGSGCHGDNCGRPANKYNLPVPMSHSEAKAMPLHPSWKMHHDWKQQAFGGVVVNNKGQFLLREPSNHFDGYHWTFPKGKMDHPLEHPADTARREVREETGRHIGIIDSLPGNFKSGSGSNSNFYLMRSGGNHPEEMDDETQNTKWASYEQARQLINQSKNYYGRKRDLAVLDKAQNHLEQYKNKDNSLASKLKGLFKIKSIAAGGPGSGCTGPNCGRPSMGSTSGTVMKNWGWKPNGQSTLLQGKYLAKTYIHPIHGMMHVGAKHYQLVKNGVAGPVIKRNKITGLPKELHSYLAKVHSAPINQAPPKPVETPKPIEDTSKPPNGMAEKYQSTTDPNQNHTFDPATGTYKSATGETNNPSSIKEGHDLGLVIPLPTPKLESTPTKAPETSPTVSNKQETTSKSGMPGTLYNTKTGKTYTYDKAQNGYVSSHSGKVLPASYVSKGYHTTGMIVEKDPKTGDLKPPKGMEEKYQGNNVLGKPETYTWNKGTGNYQTSNGHKVDTEFIKNSNNLKPAGESAKPVEEKAPRPEGGPAKPPNGMREKYYDAVLDKTYTWDSDKQKYTSSMGGTFSSNHLANKLHDGDVVPVTSKSSVVEKGSTSKPTAEDIKQKLDQVIKQATDSGKVEINKFGPTPPKADSDFTYVGSAKNMGGAFDKYEFKDGQGKSWMFKPAETLGGQVDAKKAYVDEAASKIQQLLRPEASIAAKAVTLNVPEKGDTVGSIQQIVPTQYLRGPEGKFKDFVGRDLNASPLTDWEVKGLQQEQVVDWMISNHDSHGGQFLRTSSQYPDGRQIIGVDKTQAYKWLGKDSLSANYHPNAAAGQDEPFYNKMWAQVKAGKLNFDPMNAEEVIKRAENISDNDYKKILTPLAASRFTNSKDANAFLDQAVARKNNLRSDFEQFYSGILGKKFMFDDPNQPKGLIDETKSYTYNGSPNFSKELPSNKSLLQDAVGPLLKQYGGVYGDKAKLEVNTLEKWAMKLNPETLGKISYGSHPALENKPNKPYTSEQLQSTAKGMGLYPELAAKVGVGPHELYAMHQHLSAWKDSAQQEGPALFRGAAQEVVTNQCCHNKYAQAVELEHVVTQAKIQADSANLKSKGIMNSDGTLDMSRVLNGDAATKVAAQASKAFASGSKSVMIKQLNADGWSDNKGYNGPVRMYDKNMPVEHAFSSYLYTPALAAFQSEHEWVMAAPGGWKEFKKSDLTGLGL